MSGLLRTGRQQGRKLIYLDFLSSFALRFSLMDFDGFFLESFLASLDFAIADLLVNNHNIYNIF